MVESCKLCNAETAPDSYYCRACRESIGTDESSTSTDFRMSYPMAFDHAWALLKQGETDPDKRMSWCEQCSKRISGAEVGGFTDAGPHCKECERKLRGA